jgi:UDP-N-acetyl-D-mannosaminuronic acid transferase (WecB/TagA/CpsF family)
MGVNMAATPMSANDDRRVDVLGVHVSAISLDVATERIGCWVERRDRAYVCVTGVHGVMESQSDPRLVAIHNASAMTTPDGMPLVWACRRAGVETTTRVYGPGRALCRRRRLPHHPTPKFCAICYLIRAAKMLVTMASNRASRHRPS